MKAIHLRFINYFEYYGGNLINLSNRSIVDLGSFHQTSKHKIVTTNKAIDERQWKFIGMVGIGIV